MINRGASPVISMVTNIVLMPKKNRIINELLVTPYSPLVSPVIHRLFLQSKYK